MRFLDPRTDLAFRKIFGSDRSQDILISFLNAVLNLSGDDRIIEVSIIDPYKAPLIKGWRQTYVDVRVRDERGRLYVVEMQVLAYTGFEKRILYNACKAYVGQAESGAEFKNLVDVVAITITDFIMFKELSQIVSTFRLSAQENPDICYRDLALVFVELPKFKKSLEELETTLDRWLYFLKHATSLRTVPDALAREPAVGHALDLANRGALTEIETYEQDNREMWIGTMQYVFMDRDEARRMDMEEGRKEGHREGRAEGIRDAKAETLLTILERRFGTVPDDLPPLIQGASLDRIERWLDRALDAADLRTVFTDD